MKNASLTIAFIFFGFILISQDFHWAKQGIGEGGNGMAVACDNQGNIVFALQIQDGTIWDGVTYDCYDPNPNDNSYGDDLLIVLMDTIGNTKWTYQIGSGEMWDYEWDELYDIVFDGNGDIIACGEFCSTHIFFENVLLDTCDYKGFIMKLDHQGNLKWINYTNVEPTKITTDTDNNIYFTGQFRTYGIYQNDTLFGADMGTCSDMAVYKLDTHGNLIWGNHAGTPPGLHAHNNNVEAWDIGVNSAFEVFVAGRLKLYTEQNMFITFGDDTMRYNRKLWYEGYLARLNAQGEYTGIEGGMRNMSNLEIDENDNIILTGTFYDSLVNSYIQIINDFGRYAYLMKLNANMEFEWYKEFTSDPSSAIDVECGNNGEIYYSGVFKEYINLYDTILNDSENSNFLMKVLPDGNFDWVYKMPGNIRFANDNIGLNTSGDIAYTGWLGGTEVFGDYVLDPYNTDGTHFFVSLFAPDGVVTPDGIVELGQNAQELSVSPNPASNIINIYLDGDFKVMLYNNSGMLVKQQSFSAVIEHKLIVNDLPTGIYSIVAIKNKELYSSNVLIVK
jgi:hypothetical protein